MPVFLVSRHSFPEVGVEEKMRFQSLLGLVKHSRVSTLSVHGLHRTGPFLPLHPSDRRLTYEPLTGTPVGVDILSKGSSSGSFRGPGGSFPHTPRYPTGALKWVKASESVGG